MSDLKPPYPPLPPRRTDSSYEIAVLKCTNANARAAIWAGILINGAAAVAIMAFAGLMLTTPGRSSLIAHVREPLSFFIAGVWIAGCSTAILFAAQFAERWEPRWIRVSVNVLILALLLSSFGLFAFGCHKMLDLFPSSQ